MSIEQSMENIHTGEEPTGDCLRCRYKKSVANRAYHGPKIPGGFGKCTRPGGLCEAKAPGSENKELEGAGKVEVVDLAAESGMSFAADPDAIYEISLQQIRPAPWNPPARMEPGTIKELADSISQHGQQAPVLLRPVAADDPVRYELVFGHRRLAALRLLSASGRIDPPAPGSADFGVISAFVREMSEADAMILSGIENLQRQGFSDIEEAEFFRTCGERYGESAVKILAEKLSVGGQYIRKRIKILELPECAVNLWRDGTWHVGHLEQLLRIGSPGEVEAWLREAQKSEWEWKRIVNGLVFELRERIDRMAIPLLHARFNKADCMVCRKNTKVQLSLFGGENNKNCCLDQKCFVVKQQAWLDLHWADGSCKANKELTGVAFVGGYETASTGKFGWQDRGGQIQPGQNCGDCPRYGTIVNLKCETIVERACFGDRACFDALKKGSQDGATSGKASQKDEQNGPRVEWHGEHFRQEFYMKEAPGLVAGLLTEDPRRLQLALASLCYIESQHLSGWLFERLGPEVQEKIVGHEYERHTMEQFLDGVRKLRPLEVEMLLAEAVTNVAFRRHGNYSDEFQDNDRAAIAHFLGVDFGKWEPSDEWLGKKTKGELVSYIVRESGLIEDSKFLAFMNSEGRNIGVDPERVGAKLSSWKKADLVELIKNCGVDLSGRLPDQIRKKPEGNEYAD